MNRTSPSSRTAGMPVGRDVVFGGRHARARAGLAGMVSVVLLIALPNVRADETKHGAMGHSGPVHVMDLAGVSDRDRTAHALARLLHLEITIDPPAPLLADSLRWVMPDPDQNGCPETCTYLTDTIAQMDIVRPPKTQGEVFGALLQLAEKRIALGDPVGALNSLDQAVAVVPCSFAVIPALQVRQVFLLEARAALLLDKDRARAAMANVLAVDPSYEPPSNSTKTWAALYRSVATRQSDRAIPVDRTGIEDDAYLDGRPISQTATVVPGTHVYQVVSPFGEVRSTVVRIPAVPGEPSAPDAGVSLASLDDFGLPSRQQVMEILRHNLILGRINGLQVIAIERYLSRTGKNVVAFLVEPPRGAYSGVKFYQLGAGPSDTPPPALLPPGRPRQRLFQRLRSLFGSLLAEPSPQSRVRKPSCWAVATAAKRGPRLAPSWQGHPTAGCMARNAHDCRRSPGDNRIPGPAG